MTFPSNVSISYGISAYSSVFQKKLNSMDLFNMVFYDGVVNPLKTMVCENMMNFK
jgi:hypothetical protein